MPDNSTPRPVRRRQPTHPGEILREGLGPHAPVQGGRGRGLSFRMGSSVGQGSRYRLKVRGLGF